jgi:predicted HAD superfamily Cof-like phosphohydrolase
MNQQLKNIETMHKMYGRTVSDLPIVPSQDIKLYLNLMFEELIETTHISSDEANFLQSVFSKSLEKVDFEKVSIRSFHDGLLDMQVILTGMFLMSGTPIKRGLQEIFDSNMSKTQKDGTLLRREDGKILKGENYFAPSMSKVLLINYPFSEFTKEFDEDYFFAWGLVNYDDLKVQDIQKEHINSTESYLFSSRQTALNHNEYTLFENNTISKGWHPNSKFFFYLSKDATTNLDF